MCCGADAWKWEGQMSAAAKKLTVLRLHFYLTMCVRVVRTYFPCFSLPMSLKKTCYGHVAWNMSQGKS